MGAEPPDFLSTGQLCRQGLREDYPFERDPQTQRQLPDVLWGILEPCSSYKKMDLQPSIQPSPAITAAWVLLTFLRKRRQAWASGLACRKIEVVVTVLHTLEKA